MSHICNIGNTGRAVQEFPLNLWWCLLESERLKLSGLFQELAFSELDVQGPGAGWDHGLVLNDLGIYPAF